ncbi:MAG TPA: type II toxin-antitoxin system mRNA interferase toxin, RelE/StbE family [Novimethylophilus sp.]|uniref:type II toxin-antitoxin system RelE family toxin n=1 Tax=Novimethylophilus sp. TaxID=2137426 RepID=UPI002F3E40AA
MSASALSHKERAGEQFRNKLQERLINPRVPALRLAGQNDRYKIKLRSVGYRLYEIRDSELVVIAVGKRERNAAYKAAAKR